jgi:hypothetical protein
MLERKETEEVTPKMLWLSLPGGIFLSWFRQVKSKLTELRWQE